MSNGISIDPWWHAKPGRETKEAYNKGFSVVNEYVTAQSHLTAELLKWYRLYGNFPARGLGATSYFRPSLDVRSKSRLTLNVVKSCVDTVTSKIGRHRPKPTFLTSGGSWSQQKRAKNLDKFVWGQFYQAGVYRTSPLIFRDAGIFGTGYGKPYVSECGKGKYRISFDRVFPEEVVHDQVESIFGTPRSVYQRRNVSREVLLAEFPEFKDEIKRANSAYADSVAAGYKTQADLITVVEGWHIPSGYVEDGMEEGDHDGRHSVFIENCTLVFEEYRNDYFPLIPLHWTKPQKGVRGQGLAEELVGIQYEINKLLRQIQESTPWAVPKCFIESGSAVVKDHINDEIGGIIKYRGTPPEIKAIQAISPELFSQLDRLYQRAYEITGISQLSATSKKPAGLESGKALLVYQDVESERFATVQRDYDDFHLEIARQFVNLAKDIAKDDPAYGVLARDRHKTIQLDWKDVNIDETDYVMQITPTSGLPQSVAGRLQAVEDLMNLGVLPKEEIIRLLDFPDLEAVNRRAEADAEFCNMQIDKMVEGKQAQTPEPFQNLQYAIKQAQAVYLQVSTMDDVSDKSLELLRTYMEQCASMMKESQAASGQSGVAPTQQGAEEAAQPQEQMQGAPQESQMAQVQ